MADLFDSGGLEADADGYVRVDGMARGVERRAPAYLTGNVEGRLVQAVSKAWAGEADDLPNTGGQDMDPDFDDASDMVPACVFGDEVVGVRLGEDLCRRGL